jgi:uncharacterized protein DUF4397
MNRALAWCVAAAAALSVAPLAAPADAAPAASYAVVRGAHFSPDTPGVDVYLTAFSGGRSSLFLSNVGYGDVSAYRHLKPGPYVVAMRKHGASSSSPAALSWNLDAQAGAAYTVAAVGRNAQLRGIVLRDQLAPPAKGTGRVRVIQAASRAPHAKIVAGTRTVAPDAAFASTTGYATVPAGTWEVKATGVPSQSPSTQSRVAIAASGVYSLVVLDSKGTGIEVRTVRDAAGTAAAPHGSIDAGAGGTATSVINSPGAGPAGLWVGGVALLGAAFVLALRLRRRLLR